MAKNTILITGASAGIGKATALHLAEKMDCDLILAARRTEKLDALKTKIKSLNPSCSVHIYALDVRDREQVKSFFEKIKQENLAIDVLINNAGLSQGLDPIHEGDLDDWERMIDTNIKGVLYLTKGAFPFLKSSAAPQIINIGSIAAKEVYPNGNVYNATKHAVDALNKAMRIDLLKENIKVSAVHPGMVETEFSEVRFKGDKERAKKVYEGFDPLTGDDIAKIIRFILELPWHVNINDMLVMPFAQANAYITKKEN